MYPYYGPYYRRYRRFGYVPPSPMPFYMPPPYPPYPPSPEDELRMLEEYKRDLEEDLKELEEELKSVEARIEELRKSLGKGKT